MTPTRTSLPYLNALPRAAVWGAFLIAGTACMERRAADPFASGPNASLSGQLPRTLVCHLTGTGAYIPLTINGNAVAAHRSHGDALPGEAVPGMPGYVFDSDCVPLRLPTDLTGVWAGTYSWDCGGTRTGSSPIRFVLTDPRNGSITGTVSYLGGTSELVADDPLQASSRRISDPIFRTDGTLLGGRTDPDGMWVSLITDGAAGFFVNNEFNGEIAADFGSITGGTLNGDSPVPGSAGCSAPTGYSGSFTVARVN